MAITVYTEDQIFNQTMAYFAVQFPTQDLTDKGFLGLLARAFAQTVVLLQDSIEDADNDAVPAYRFDAEGNAVSKASSAALDAWAFVFGLPSGTSGVYGRRGATGSSGGTAIPTGVAGTVVGATEDGTESTGQITIQTVADVTLNGPPNTLPVTFSSVTTGAQSNLPVGTVITWLSPPAGLDATCTLTTAMTGGQDRETDSELLARILLRLQNIPRGGTAADYRVWAEESTDSSQNNKSNNIDRAHVFPHRQGLGSVDVMPLVSGTGTGRDPGATVAAAVLAYLNTKRPVTAIVNVIRPYMPSTLALRIWVRVTPHTKYAFDWDDNATPVSVVSSTANTIVIANGDFDADLRAAIDAGKLPRVQVASTNTAAASTPYQMRVTSYAVAANTTLTLTSSFATNTNPLVTDQLMAGGPVVDLVATAIKNYVDSLGPSNQTGYADEFDPWDWKVDLSRIIDEVMDVKDTDNQKMIALIDNPGTLGVRIAIGAGAFAATTYTPRDVLNNCELAFLRAGGIQVTK